MSNMSELMIKRLNKEICTTCGKPFNKCECYKEIQDNIYFDEEREIEEYLNR